MLAFIGEYRIEEGKRGEGCLWSASNSCFGRSAGGHFTVSSVVPARCEKAAEVGMANHHVEGTLHPRA